MTNHVKILSNAIVDNGHRLTHARQTIIETLASCEGHITADNLVALEHKQEPRVGRMTVYRTLDLLCELGKIRPIYQGTGAAHYILMTEGSHHHFICNQCHAVIEFDECTAGEVANQLAERFHFQVFSHLLELHGLCQNCLSS